MRSKPIIRTIAVGLLALTPLLSHCASDGPVTNSTSASRISVSISPGTASMPPGGAQDFVATVANDPSTPWVAWYLTGPGCSGTACGTLSANNSASGDVVSYSAPTTRPTPATVTVTAVSANDNSKSAAATITITPLGPVSVSISPTTASVPIGTSQDFNAWTTNDPGDAGVAWTLSGSGCSGAACGTLSPDSTSSGGVVTYTAPATIPTPATVTLTATSILDKSKSATATIIITPPSIVISFILPGGAALSSAPDLRVNGQWQVAATVANDPKNAGVTWTITHDVPGPSCSGAACGSLSATSSASGEFITYTAPPTVPNPGYLYLIATSVTDPTKFEHIYVTISSGISVSVAPSMAGVDLNTSQEFTASLTNDATNAGVNWTVSGSGCSGAACGTFSAPSSASGVPVNYTAPATVPDPAIVTVTATSVVDPNKSATATVVITTPGVLTVVVSPANTTLCTLAFSAGGHGRPCRVTLTRTFTAYVFNDPSNAGVSWSAGIGSVSPTTSASGVPITYTVPSGSCGSTSVTATTVADGARSATATVTLVNQRHPPGC